jgi:prepilin-type N-terminal cleavage/methylation domain-containing protein
VGLARKDVMHTRHHTERGQPGFTLIELLVVMGIITFLASLAVLVGPALLRNEKASRGAQELQGHLFVAKQQALRDRFPYGLRLIADPDGQCRSYQYIRQPPDYTGGTAGVLNDPNDPTSLSRAIFNNIDLSGGLPAAQQNLWPVQVGDFIQISTNDYRLITGVTGTPGVPPNPPTSTVTVAPAFVAAIPDTTDYRIARAPRAAPGEDIVSLPDDVIIDLGPGRSVITPELRPDGSSHYDILFAPGGTILGPGGQSGKIILWVRDAAQADEQSLIVVFTRTGLIAAYPVDTTSGNPYSFTYDPRPGGL